jgi:hypothetical protein
LLKSLRLAPSARCYHMLQDGATSDAAESSQHQRIDMRSLPTSSQVINPQQNKAGLIADLVIVVLFLVLLAVR